MTKRNTKSFWAALRLGELDKDFIYKIRENEDPDIQTKIIGQLECGPPECKVNEYLKAYAKKIKTYVENKSCKTLKDCKFQLPTNP